MWIPISCARQASPGVYLCVQLRPHGPNVSTFTRHLLPVNPLCKPVLTALGSFSCSKCASVIVINMISLTE